MVDIKNISLLKETKPNTYNIDVVSEWIKHILFQLSYFVLTVLYIVLGTSKEMWLVYFENVNKVIINNN